MLAPETLVVQALERFPEVERVILFGSRARGDGGARADIDVAVACPAADNIRWFDIIDAVEDAPTLLEIDLVRLEEVPAELAANILREGRVLYERDQRLTAP
ncbi:MAG TPA: nucleotidyltransferase domain-containing protein [Rhizomicrobium sp.]|jgi:predicted nucleotidyltransferase|nr:nucleotidyltransferase domain-containing protein [Rhizomicrobium sp.]